MDFGYNIFDEDPDAPFLRQQALSTNVRANPALATPSSGVETPQSRRSSYSVSTGGGTPGQAAATLAQINERIGRRPDAGPLIQYAAQRRAAANQGMLNALALSLKGGETLKPYAEHVLTNA